MIFSVRKELILVALAGTVVVMGLGFIIPLFPIYVPQKGVTNFQLGLIVSGFTISQFLVQPFFGGLSDRFGRKLFMVGGLACYGFVASLYVLATSLSHVFLIGAAGLGIAIWASSALSPELSKTVQMAPAQPPWAIGKERQD
jgi:MFS family permease